MHLAGSPAEAFGGLEVAADQVSDECGRLRRNRVGVGSQRCHRWWQLSRLHGIVEAAHLVGRVGPAVGLALDQLLNHGDG